MGVQTGTPPTACCCWTSQTEHGQCGHHFQMNRCPSEGNARRTSRQHRACALETGETGTGWGTALEIDDVGLLSGVAGSDCKVSASKSVAETTELVSASACSGCIHARLNGNTRLGNMDEPDEEDVLEATTGWCDSAGKADVTGIKDDCVSSLASTDDTPSADDDDGEGEEAEAGAESEN